MPDINDLKDSADKLAAQARETAEIGVQVVRDQIHNLIKDPDARRRLEEAEEVIDRQVQDAQRKIEEGAKEMMTMVSNFLANTPLANAPIFKGGKDEGEHEAK